MSCIDGNGFFKYPQNCVSLNFACITLTNSRNYGRSAEYHGKQALHRKVFVGMRLLDVQSPCASDCFLLKMRCMTSKEGHGLQPGYAPACTVSAVETTCFSKLHDMAGSAFQALRTNVCDDISRRDLWRNHFLLQRSRQGRKRHQMQGSAARACNACNSMAQSNSRCLDHAIFVQH